MQKHQKIHSILECKLNKVYSICHEQQYIFIKIRRIRYKFQPMSLHQLV